MSGFEAILYGVVQGITEYLPVSSSAHLILLPRFLGQRDPGLAFDVFLHIGTLLATLAFFWRDWRDLLSWKKPSPLLKPIILGTIPALLAGALLHHWVEDVLRGNVVIATTLVLGGGMLYGIDRKWPVLRGLDGIKSRDAIVVGLFQCLALIPGMSRSGSTITAGRFLGFDRASSARFSFLLSAPVTGAAILFELRHWRLLMNGVDGVTPLVLALLASFVSGTLAIGALMALLRRFGYGVFAFYRVLLAIVILNVLGA